MGLRSAGKPALLLKLADVCEAITADLTKKVKPHPLVVVHSKEIDDAGEANVGLPTFESTLRQIKAAWHHLQLAGVKNCVFTADHGFLLQDETTEVRRYDEREGRQRRHVLDDHPRAEAGMVNVSVSSLGYDGLSGYLLFREDTAVFVTGQPWRDLRPRGQQPARARDPRAHRHTEARRAGWVLRVRRRGEPAGWRSWPAPPSRPGVPRQGDDHGPRFRVAGAVDLALRVPGRDAVRVICKDVSGAGKLKAGRVQVPVGEAWTEVFFGLEGPI